MNEAKLVFSDGQVFEGEFFTQTQMCFGEVVFNTAMTGYQEILSDPSYSGQMVTMTYPIIGSYGVNLEDDEASVCHAKALIVKEYFPMPSNWRSNGDLKGYCDRHNVVGIQGVDTRYLTRYLRDKGAQKAALVAASVPTEDVVKQLRDQPSMEGQNLVSDVSVTDSYVVKAEMTRRFKVAVIDCGIKQNILRIFSRLNCECHVLPYTTTVDEIKRLEPDGVFISNGPGDPSAVTEVIETLKSLMPYKPTFGICLGHQLISLALGAQTFKLPFGHHGANHPILDQSTGQVCVTSQNHGFCVDEDSLKSCDVDVTHVNLNDATVAGIQHRNLPVFSVQYHPEAAPGPTDSFYLFDRFLALMEARS